jgi:tetratricopeptide (TPR) repeat protein
MAGARAERPTASKYLIETIGGGVAPAAMICLCLLFVLAAQEPSTEVVQHVQAGISAEKVGQHDAAISEFGKAVALDPDFAIGYVDLATVYMAQRKYTEATVPLKRAVLLDPGVPGVQRMLGYALLFQGYAAESIPHFQLVNDNGGLGAAQLETGDLTEAIANLQAALAEHPGDPALLSQLARAAGVLSRETKDTLLATHPDSAQAHATLAGDYWALQKAADAEKEYETALHLDPGLSGAHLGLGQIYEKTLQWQKAEQEYQAEAKLRPGSAEAAYRLGNALLENGKLQSATTELTRANTLQPDMPETLYALGKAEAMNGNSLAAEKDWNRVLALETDTELAQKTHFGLAGVYRKLGRRADAEREMKAFEDLKAQ